LSKLSPQKYKTLFLACEREGGPAQRRPGE